MEGKRAVPEERETNADGLGSSLLLLAHSFQEQPHRCALESNVLDFVLNLVFKTPQTQGGMDEAHCKGTGVLIGNTGISRANLLPTSHQNLTLPTPLGATELSSRMESQPA